MIVYATEYIGNTARQRRVVARLYDLLLDIQREHKIRGHRNHYLRVAHFDGMLVAVTVASVANYGWHLLVRIGPADTRARHRDFELWDVTMDGLMTYAMGELKHEVAHDD